MYFLNLVNKTLPLLWGITLIAYLMRSVFEPLKYAFFAMAPLLVLFIIWQQKQHAFSKLKPFVQAVWPFLVLLLYVGVAILWYPGQLNLVYKDLVNALVILFFVYIYFFIHNQLQGVAFVQVWTGVTFLIAILAIFKYFNYVFQWGIIFDRSDYGGSLVSDYNFFANHFLISLVLYLKFLTRQKTLQKSLLFILFFGVSILAVLFSGSRRGIMILAVFFLFFFSYPFFIKKIQQTTLIFYIRVINRLSLVLVLLVVLFFFFRNSIITDAKVQIKITDNLYRYSTIVFPKISHPSVHSYLWPKSENLALQDIQWSDFEVYNSKQISKNTKPYVNYATQFWAQFQKDSANLIYNGHFQQGLKFWRKVVDEQTNVEHQIIDDADYGKAIRVKTDQNLGYWPLAYEGRQIFYKKGQTYTFVFKYRINTPIAGNPFQVGWWLDDNGQKIINLTQNIKPLTNNWFECKASYTFTQDHSGSPVTFINTQHPNTSIDYTDIQLYSDSKTSHNQFVDQLSEYDDYFNILYNSDFSYGTRFWSSVTHDTVLHKVVQSDYGKAIRVSRGNATGYWPLIYDGRDIIFYKDIPYVFRFKYKVVENHRAFFHIGYNLTENDTSLVALPRHEYLLDSIGWKESTVRYVFKQTHRGIYPFFLNTLTANTTIDVADIELLVPDTVTRPLYLDEILSELRLEEKKQMQEMVLNDNKNNKDAFGQTRLERWVYAGQIFSEYSFLQQLFGGGFGFVTQFAYHFYPDGEPKHDWPHNPIVTAFLYSGVLGGLFYTFFLVKSFVLYWRYKQKLAVFFIMYGITLSFSLFSGKTHFSIPIFVVLSIIPFIFQIIHAQKK